MIHRQCIITCSDDTPQISISLCKRLFLRANKIHTFVMLQCSMAILLTLVPQLLATYNGADLLTKYSCNLVIALAFLVPLTLSVA